MSDLKRSIERWQKCDPKAMATMQSATAVEFALADAKFDIMTLDRQVTAQVETIRCMESTLDKIAQALGLENGDVDGIGAAIERLKEHESFLIGYIAKHGIEQGMKEALAAGEAE